MARVIWPDGTLDQLDQIVAYIEIFDAPAADRMRRRLLQLGNSLDTFPNRGRPRPDGTRELTTVPPYVLRYDVHGDVVVIVDIRHGRQQSAE